MNKSFEIITDQVKDLQFLVDRLLKVKTTTSITDLKNIIEGKLDGIVLDCLKQNKMNTYPKRVQELEHERITECLEDIRGIALHLFKDINVIRWDMLQIDSDNKVYIDPIEYVTIANMKRNHSIDDLLLAHKLYNSLKGSCISDIMLKESKTYSDAKQQLEMFLAVHSIPELE